MDNNDRESLIDALMSNAPLIRDYDWLGTGSSYPSEAWVRQEVGEVADAVFAWLASREQSKAEKAAHMPPWYAEEAERLRAWMNGASVKEDVIRYHDAISVPTFPATRALLDKADATYFNYSRDELRALLDEVSPRLSVGGAVTNRERDEVSFRITVYATFSPSELDEAEEEQA